MMRGRTSNYAELPSELFKRHSDLPDPFFVRPDLRWRLRRLIDPMSHRWFVGGDAGSGLPFREAGRFQLDFMRSVGMEPDDVFLDLGCGALRGGIHFIDFLDTGCYLGVDVSAEAVFRGITKELGREAFDSKRPEFAITGSFDFSSFSKKPRFVLANSLFTHLPPPEVARCLDRLGRYAPGAVLYSTFTRGSGAAMGAPHYYGGKTPFTYSIEEMTAMGENSGWECEYIGDWGHPKNAWDGGGRRQMMMAFSR